MNKIPYHIYDARYPALFPCIHISLSDFQSDPTFDTSVLCMYPSRKVRFEILLVVVQFRQAYPLKIWRLNFVQGLENVTGHTRPF